MPKLTHAPCQICRQVQPCQLEFIESNGGKPWDTCSACDPGLVDAPSNRVAVFRAGPRRGAVVPHWSGMED